MPAEEVTLSIITASYNAVRQLPALIDSLRLQTDLNFEWVVADGASTDGTLELLKEVDDLNIVVSSQPDFGIYDALNRAIRMANGEYYIVAGADDTFHPEAIMNFRSAIRNSGADLVVASVRQGGTDVHVKKKPAWMVGQFAYIASHVLAVAIKKSLHETFGFYSKKYPIASDQLFIMRAFEYGASHYISEFIAGEIGMEGSSSRDRIGGATEVFRVQLDLGRSKFFQTMLLMLRLLKAYCPTFNAGHRRSLG